MSSSAYDFIVVGGGPAGSTLASRLAGSNSKPSVLLVEAGVENTELTNRIPGERYDFFAKNGAALDYGYKTAPQKETGGREIPYHRGKCLGGSTATNMCIWDYGSKEELNEWAGFGGLERLKNIENYHNNTPAEYEEYVKPDPDTHGKSGPVDVTLPGVWEPGLKVILDAAKAYGLPMMPDINSENNIGFGIAPSTTYRGLRTTAASAYLSEIPDNLTIITQSKVIRILFEGTKAIGINLLNRTKYFAKKELILSAGSIDTPKLLLLSGVGPVEDLKRYNIPLVADLPGVGSNLRDHHIVRLRTSIKPGSLLPLDINVMRGAREQWIKDQTGPLGADNGLLALGYFKLDMSTLPEFELLDQQMQDLLLHPSVPTYELGAGIRQTPGSDEPILSTSIILMHSQSSGKISLAGPDPELDPIIDMNCLSHPYDRRVMIEALKKTLDFIENSTLPTGKYIVGPSSIADEDISKFVKETISIAWHALGTVKMGKHGEEGTCVTSDFCVVGVQNLRVVDLSVCPVIPSNHTQSTAYLVGETAAQSLIDDYQLDAVI